LKKDIIENNKPLLRWAGGKSWLVKHLDLLLPKSGFKNYHEPFLGGASMFLSINPSENSFLSDLNFDLISTYNCIKLYPEEIIELLKTFENTEDFYYYIRADNKGDEIFKAAKFIYLNQTSFNGIYRVNLQGKYNVPYGYRTKDFIQSEKLRNVSKILGKAHIFTGDFDVCQQNIKPKDLIFLDPPYTVSHNNNGFIKYNQKLFSLEDQVRLSELINKIKEKDAYYILTNAAHAKILEIFEKGDRLIELNRASLIGGTNAKRGQTSEYIFTNITDL